MVHIGKRLKKMRLAKGLTQGDILKLTGIMRCYTSHIESGGKTPSLHTLEKYAKAFAMPLHDLLYQLTYQPDKEPKVEEIPETVEPQSNSTEVCAEAQEFIPVDNTGQA